jgi:hypothetical protein
MPVIARPNAVDAVRGTGRCRVLEVDTSGDCVMVGSSLGNEVGWADLVDAPGVEEALGVVDELHDQALRTLMGTEDPMASPVELRKGRIGECIGDSPAMFGRCDRVGAGRFCVESGLSIGATECTIPNARPVPAMARAQYPMSWWPGAMSPLS